MSCADIGLGIHLRGDVELVDGGEKRRRLGGIYEDGGCGYSSIVTFGIRKYSIGTIFHASLSIICTVSLADYAYNWSTFRSPIMIFTLRPSIVIPTFSVTTNQNVSCHCIITVM